MPHPRVRLTVPEFPAPIETVEALRQRFVAVRAEQEISEDYPADALAEAEAAAADPVRIDRDDTDVPFVTLDPVGSKDLDQAFAIDRVGSGFRVRYAIADVPAVIRPGGALDRETRRRAVTVYCPDRRVPLHPTVLSEGAASLLPGVDRPAFVWDLTLDADGVVTERTVYRSLIRSRAQWDYASVQQDLDAGREHPVIGLLREVGLLRAARERDRGGASLPLPEQEVSATPDGGFVLEFRPPRPVEEWNAQLSLMTGMAAADIQLEGGVGLLRTMPEPSDEARARFRRAARALGAPWPDGMDYGAFIASLDREQPRHLALIYEATTLFRGAGYTPFDGEMPEQRIHAAVAAPYAHVTAPLRRLVDRFGLVVSEALVAGREVPDWARESLASLPEAMRDGERPARAAERGCADAMEAAVLAPRVGEDFAAVAIEVNDRGGIDLQLTEVPVLARAEGRGVGLGDEVRARLTLADIATSEVRFVIPG